MDAEAAPADHSAPSKRPVKLTGPLLFRLLLELGLVAAFWWWGWRWAGEGTLGLMLGVLFMLAAMFAWGLFATPNDPARGGNGRVAVPGWTRLLIECTLFSLAAYGLWTIGSRAAAETLLTAAAVHFAFTWERLRWLLRP